ncbi:MAG: hypothetical protein JSR82_05290 [Verrucomicrobia bacterium]|nr:hypothetical protein [Verrucomicrobiota bacterium]
MRRLLFVLLVCLLTAASLLAEERPPTPRPFEQKPFETLSNAEMSRHGVTALGFRPERWLHGETENFIIHYRRITEAKRVGLEIEYHLWYVARALAAAPERYQRKSHVFIFEDEKEWADFKTIANIVPWASSLAAGDELFLNLRDGRTGMFDSRTLAHETTHAVVARIYPGQRLPLWLSEGFAEVMARKSSAARVGQYPGVTQALQRMPDYSLHALLGLELYPSSPVEVLRFYRSAERLTRFLTEKQAAALFPTLVEALLAGQPFPAAVVSVYGPAYPNFGEFEKAFARFQAFER